MNNYEYANRSLMVDLQGFTISNIAINRRMKEIDNAYVKIEPKM